MRKTVRLMAMTAVMGMAAGCKTAATATEKEEAKTMPEVVEEKKPVMPQGRLLTVEYNYQDMNMMPLSHPRLKRTDDGATLTVWVSGKGDTVLQVSDTLLDAARTIIEEDSMYAYDSSYGLPPELERQLLDGFRWEFWAFFEGKQHLSSRGRHVMPKDSKGLHRLNTLLINAAQACLQETPAE